MDSPQLPPNTTDPASPDVAAVVLAAGESRRFGSPKQVAMLEGMTLLDHVLHIAVAAGLQPVVAVVPVWLSQPARWRDDRVLWVPNPHPERGMSESLRRGLAALPALVQAAVILLGDQPHLAIETIAAVVAARGRSPLIAAHADGRLAPPVLIERERFGLAEQVSGDIGLREILRRHPDDVTAVEVAAHAPDVDTPDDLGRA